jgi:peptidoglycan/LPS O-acetylase OafA/YrhL
MEIKQLPSFNGWRAIGILLVLGQHTALTNGFPSRYYDLVFNSIGGNLGVRFFFTVSGFLITWLMLKEEGEFGCVSLRHFYIRRALRILPAYLACIFVMAIIQNLGILAQKGTTWFQLLTFTRNFYQTGHVEDPISGTFWSLSVEELFYFLWPVVFLLLGHSSKRRIYCLISIIIFSIGYKIIALLGCYNRHLWFLFQELSTFLYLDCIAYGCLGAILLHTSREKLERFFERYSLLIFSFSCLFLLVPGIVGLGRGMQSFGFILLLLQSVMFSKSRPFKILNHSWMVKIGILSYSLYIWHLIVFMLWPIPRLWFLALPATFGAAWISYNLLEKPFLSLRAKFRHR